MMKHKWHKEIKAWADGAKIERRNQKAGIDWESFNGHWATGAWWEYRVKQPIQKPPYLYVYKDSDGIIYLNDFLCGDDLLGKMKLEDL